MKNFLMDEKDYYSRHENDGTAEIAGFCFLGAVVCIILALIF